MIADPFAVPVYGQRAFKFGVWLFCLSLAVSSLLYSLQGSPVPALTGQPAG